MRRNIKNKPPVAACVAISEKNDNRTQKPKSKQNKPFVAKFERR